MDITIVYYTSNYLETKNPKFVEKTREQLLKAAGDRPIIVVSQKPTKIGNSVNVCVGDIGRSHLNIYRQILEGAKAATTDYVAMAEDDILYSYEHYHPEIYIKNEFIRPDLFLYDMAKVSIFTWTKPPMFSFRTKRKVVNQLIAPRKMLIESLEERFERVEFLKSKGWPEEKIIKYWGDPGRYEHLLGVTPRKSYEFYSWVPSVVFSHEHAFGYLYQGKKKKIGDLRIIELADWGKASDIVKMFYEG
jgi:hypothetical protein